MKLMSMIMRQTVTLHQLGPCAPGGASPFASDASYTRLSMTVTKKKR